MAFGKVPEQLLEAVKSRIWKDPSKIPPSQLTISQRGRKVALFSRQLCSMMTGGVSLTRSMEVLGEQNEDPVFAYVITDLSKKLAQGFSFSKAASHYNKIFPPVFVHLAATGESTGQLVRVIERLSDLLENEEDIVKKVRGAMSYPIFIAVITFVLTIALFSTVLPSFAEFYSDFDVELPTITSVLMTLTKIVRSPWTWIISLPLLYGIYRGLATSWENPSRRLYMYQAVLAIPLIGPILELSCLARFCWVMELTTDAGLDLMRSLRLAGMASGSATFQADTNRLVRGITDGDQLSELMQIRFDYYPSLLYQMVLLGEETSRYSESFGRAGGWFEAEVESRIQGFQAALEPIMMAGIALLVGGIVVAVFLPLYGLLDKLG